MPTPTEYRPEIPEGLESEYQRIDGRVRDILREYMHTLGKPVNSFVSYPKVAEKPYSYYWKVGDSSFSVQVYLFVDKRKPFIGRLLGSEEPHLRVLFSEDALVGQDVLGKILCRELQLPVKISKGTRHYDHGGGLDEPVWAEYRPEDVA